MRLQLSTRKGWVHPRLANKLLKDGVEWHQACVQDYARRFGVPGLAIYRDPIDEHHFCLYQYNEENFNKSLVKLYRQGA